MKISLVIPTRERAQFFKYCLETAIRVDDEDFEIIVSDNASQDGTGDIVRACTDPRVKYVNTGKRVSMRENFEFALSHATGDYVIFIGDDDAVLSGGIKILRSLLMKHQPDVINWRLLHYNWMQDPPHKTSGILQIPNSSVFGQIEKRSASRLLKDFASAKQPQYRHGANIYHGCVSRHLIDKVSSRTEAYFNSPVPDVYTAMANLACIKDLLWLRHPVTISGESSASTGAAFFNDSKKLSKPANSSANSFISEVQSDPIQAKIDVRIKSGAALLLAELCDVNDKFLSGTLNINFEGWYGHIITALNLCSPEIRKDGIGHISDFANRTGTGKILEATIPKFPYLGNVQKADDIKIEQPQVGSRISPLKITCDLREGPRQDISEVAKIADEILGSTYRPYNIPLPSLRGFPPVFPREIKHWAGAVMRSGKVLDKHFHGKN